MSGLPWNVLGNPYKRVIKVYGVYALCTVDGPWGLGYLGLGLAWVLPTLPLRKWNLGFLLPVLHTTCTPKVRKMMAPMAVITGLGLLFYILLGLGSLKPEPRPL